MIKLGDVVLVPQLVRYIDYLTPSKRIRVINKARHSGECRNPEACGTCRQQPLLPRFHYLYDINLATFHEPSLGGAWTPACAGMTSC